MITYTDEVKPVRKYSPEEILAMDPKQLKTSLCRLIAKEPDMAGKIEATLGYEVDWDDLNTWQYFLLAVCWAKLEDPTATKELIDRKFSRFNDILSN